MFNPPLTRSLRWYSDKAGRGPYSMGINRVRLLLATLTCSGSRRSMVSISSCCMSSVRVQRLPTGKWTGQHCKINCSGAAVPQGGRQGAHECRGFYCVNSITMCCCISDLQCRKASSSPVL